MTAADSPPEVDAVWLVWHFDLHPARPPRALVFWLFVFYVRERALTCFDAHTMTSMDGKQGKVPDIHYSSTLLVVSVRQLSSTILHLVSSNVITPSLAFDTSHLIVSPAFSTAFRWDAIHFASIAKYGYEYEQQLAFMPFWPFLMRVGAEGLAKARTVVVNRLGVELPHDIGYSDVIIAGGMINILAAAAAAMFLYK